MRRISTVSYSGWGKNGTKRKPKEEWASWGRPSSAPCGRSPGESPVRVPAARPAPLGAGPPWLRGCRMSAAEEAAEDAITEVGGEARADEPGKI